MTRTIAVIWCDLFGHRFWPKDIQITWQWDPCVLNNMGERGAGVALKKPYTHKWMECDRCGHQI